MTTKMRQSDNCDDISPCKYQPYDKITSANPSSSARMTALTPADFLASCSEFDFFLPSLISLRTFSSSPLSSSFRAWDFSLRDLYISRKVSSCSAVVSFPLRPSAYDESMLFCRSMVRSQFSNVTRLSSSFEKGSD